MGETEGENEKALVQLRKPEEDDTGKSNKNDERSSGTDELNFGEASMSLADIDDTNDVSLPSNMSYGYYVSASSALTWCESLRLFSRETSTKLLAFGIRKHTWCCWSWRRTGSYTSSAPTKLAAGNSTPWYVLLNVDAMHGLPLYGMLSAKLSDTAHLEFRLECLSTGLSIAVGILWLVLISLGKLNGFFRRELVGRRISLCCGTYIGGDQFSREHTPRFYLSMHM